jgi:hypothetical protein
MRWMSGVLTAIVLGSSPASAQTVTVLECRPRVGVAIGAATNSDDAATYGGLENRRRRTHDLSGTVEVPLFDRWSARADVGSAAWTVQFRDPEAAAPRPDRMRVTRVTFSAVKQSPHPCGAPVRLYGGFGYGAYHYRLKAFDASMWRGGAHAIGGLEVTPRDHLAVAADLSLHAIGGPRRVPLNTSMLLVLQFNIGVRLVF